MAFVIIQHLDPKHQSFLTNLLSKETAMKVVEVKNGMEVQPNYVYVIPPNASMSIHGAHAASETAKDLQTSAEQKNVHCRVLES